VLVSASRRNNLFLTSASSADERTKGKFAIARTRSPARETRALPNFANAREVIRPSVGGIVRARTRDLVSK